MITMLVKNDAQFMELQWNLDAEPAIQIISKASIVDVEPEYDYENKRPVDASYLVETIAIRLNHVALNEWLDSATPVCYPPENYGLSWEQYKEKNGRREKRREALEKRIRDDLGVDMTRESFAISQIAAEFFAVVTMRKICETPRKQKQESSGTA